jgi:hypothetical protein
MAWLLFIVAKVKLDTRDPVEILLLLYVVLKKTVANLPVDVLCDATQGAENPESMVAAHLESKMKLGAEREEAKIT